MSSTSLIEFLNNKAVHETEFGNSWGGAARIWTSLFGKYVKDPAKEYDNWLCDQSGRLWKLADRSDLPLCERAVLAFTFDQVIVRREHFEQFASHLREFVALNPFTGVDHLPAWSNVFLESESEAIGLHATSVNSNPWFTTNEETEDYESVDLATFEHSEVYDTLKQPENVTL